MSSINRFAVDEIRKSNPILSDFRSIIETAFYGNNVSKVTELKKAYELASDSPGTIKTDLPLFKAEEMGLPEDARILVFNDGKVFGRTAAARRIIGQPGIDAAYFSGILREAIYQGRQKEFYHGTALVGLAESFMIKAHLMTPKGFENNLYSYLLNFQMLTEEYKDLYQSSKIYNEGDIYIYADPDWSHPDFPHGLALFDPIHNVAAILGLRYFGELKKATLTLAWATAHRNNFIACHGGVKQYDLDGEKYTMAVFGLSGSGKSTITLSDHGNKFNMKVLHDDAFIIEKGTGATTALEPSYFDKTQDYPMGDKSIKYFLTCQNVGVTLDKDDKKVLVTEDIRNGNGRTIKSRFVIPNRENHLTERINSIFWIMKDDSLPPILKINNPILASIFGLTLATKRSTAENVVSGVDINKLVIEPFANPFRCYALNEDYQNFKHLFEEKATDCYILNTGFFRGEKVTPAQTLGSIEKIIANEANFKVFGSLEDISYLPVDNHIPDFENKEYVENLIKGMENRLDFLNDMKSEMDGYNALPEETNIVIERIISELK
ncbi:phosphoenolpyruvate carboxykinase (ATP) [Vagococcus carniphilus]|uniref:phosphoenolpyruvate carboxykinase (ATP) n=1 Tax=Vagococcus carniphilus TaxID=218144 RepID=UPI00288EB99E|nr:phosphoenolpyruvate carboxykinase (ATP) [Vagococcus carniphilus]MDT2829812.1 phosphoenolpyruvate carboxykinase (ATP) [Vagococcus carniphilus]MDT2839271.1 phosphoenolpyruvate carboxykinase (ATP) [Vagococcus carniphilus]MDT2853330.1 phosphoenolpyruvate carboxykinase (ATP) [Vagococcus carniphilus]